MGSRKCQAYSVAVLSGGLCLIAVASQTALRTTMAAHHDPQVAWTVTGSGIPTDKAMVATQEAMMATWAATMTSTSSISIPTTTISSMGNRNKEVIVEDCILDFVRFFVLFLNHWKGQSPFMLFFRF